MLCDPNMPAPDWCKSKFSAAELHGKSVKFKVHTQDGIEAGKGKLIVEPGSKGYIRAAVRFVNESNSKVSHTSDGAILLDARIEFIGLSQVAVDTIARNPPGSDCDFSMLAG